MEKSGSLPEKRSLRPALRAGIIEHSFANSEPVFTAEDAGWARDFSARQGAFSQEYFVYCKKTQRGMAEKDPPTRRLRL